MRTADYASLDQLGIKKLEIAYSGHGDEGWVEDVVVSEPAGLGLSHENERLWQAFAYDLLESQYPGWEIDEGSSGTITVDAAARVTSVAHGWDVISKQYENKEF